MCNIMTLTFYCILVPVPLFITYSMNYCSILLWEYEMPKFCEETTHLQFYHKHK